MKDIRVTIERIQVWSRWGELVYDHKNGDQGWDGTYKGKPIPTDVYAYVVELTLSDGKNYREWGSYLDTVKCRK